jgi:hypothetical protein
MFELKPLSPEAIPRALSKAERYRLLNEPAEAESICLDVLRADPENQQALIDLLLALTDRFGRGYAVGGMSPEEVLPRLKSEYDRAYYAGVICERRAKAQHRQGLPGTAVHDGFRKAMTHYERAAAMQPAGNEDATLRWNTCARILMRNLDLPQGAEDNPELPLE